jgi:hypothetical protein
MGAGGGGTCGTGLRAGRGGLTSLGDRVVRACTPDDADGIGISIDPNQEIVDPLGGLEPGVDMESGSRSRRYSVHLSCLRRSRAGRSAGSSIPGQVVTPGPRFTADRWRGQVSRCTRTWLRARCAHQLARHVVGRARAEPPKPLHVSQLHWAAARTARHVGRDSYPDSRERFWRALRPFEHRMPTPALKGVCLRFHVECAATARTTYQGGVDN